MKRLELQYRFAEHVGFERTPDRGPAAGGGKGELEPRTLGQALAADARLIVWCKTCNHPAEPDLATLVAQHGAGMPVVDWARLLRCTEECGARDADFVVTGERR